MALHLLAIVISMLFFYIQAMSLLSAGLFNLISIVVVCVEYNNLRSFDMKWFLMSWIDRCMDLYGAYGNVSGQTVKISCWSNPRENFRKSYCCSEWNLTYKSWLLFYINFFSLCCSVMKTTFVIVLYSRWWSQWFRLLSLICRLSVLWTISKKVTEWFTEVSYLPLL